MNVYQKRRVIKEVINRNFTFADLSPRFENVDSSTGNIFCPFHENHETPAAKMYWDERRELWILHCFGECHRNFTAYDYVALVLCIKYQRYENPFEFLKEKLDNVRLKQQIQLYKDVAYSETETYYEERIAYIDNVFADCENVEEYIEILYTS